MLSSQYLFIPIILQMLVVGFDEVYFHNRREISRPEQLGHALDTLTVLVCFILALLVPPSPGVVLVFVLLSCFSCLFIAKDEINHHESCEAGERWSHAMAFTLHPLVFISVGLLWPALHLSGATGATGNSVQTFHFIHYVEDERLFISGIAALLTLFGLYELLPRELVWRNIVRRIKRREVAFDL